jgi:hypothetical protein
MWMLSRALISMVAAVAAIILVATAAIFLCAALYLFLVSLWVAPPLAALFAGLAALILAGLIMLAARMAPGVRRTSRTRGPGGDGNVDDLAARLGGLAAEQLNTGAQVHPYRTFAVALLAGLAVGASPEIRNMLRKTLKD